MDDPHLDRAIELSVEKMRAKEGGPFGAVVARGADAVAEGWNQVTSHNDPTAHAEIVAIRRAATALGTFDLSGCTLYASTEPCPMCLAAAYWARVDRVVFANRRDDAAAAGFDDALIYREIALAPEARFLPMVHRPREDALEALTEWKVLPGKTPY